MGRASTPEGIRITTVGLWYVLLTVMVAVASTNTGNNALYAVLAVMFAVLILSGLLSRQNVRGLAVELTAPDEVFANRPFEVGFTLASRGLLLPRWYLLLRLTREAKPLLVPTLPRRGRSSGRIEAMVPRRGPYRFPHAHVSSLFPFGFFRKGVRYRSDLAVLVFPEIFPAAGRRPDEAEAIGDEASRRPGWGHALFSLRGFRRGDDPRGIHWKQTARTGEIVYMEREAEQVRRLSILFDNGVGELRDAVRRDRFERLVSEAATAAVDHLARGYEVELVTRDRVLGFAAGHRQRLAVLELLATIEPGPRRREPLQAHDPRSPQLRIHLEAGEERAAAPDLPEDAGAAAAGGAAAGAAGTAAAAGTSAAAAAAAARRPRA
ncbi:MAG TPA: DUF58 domain-containing protein [Thermoanaerobaculia bacterium]|nr:DUF58 domain-containing protein [Thermoanaerobaculia bacterium]